MKYVFAAERKLIFFIGAGGKNRLVEFSDRNRDGASSYSTNEATVARSIRKTSLYRRGVIQQVEGPTEEDERAALQQYAPKRPSIATVWQQPQPAKSRRSSASKPSAGSSDVPQQPSPSAKVMEFPNITFAREALSRELGIPKSMLRTKAAMDKAARDNGITIIYATD